MPSPSSNLPSRGLQILKTALFILAGIVLAIGLVTGISILTSSAVVAENLRMMLQLFGGPAVANMAAPMVSSLMINLGIVLLVLTLIMSAMLYTGGLLIARIHSLESRLSRLEANR